MGDDQSRPATAAGIWEKLITRAKVEAALAPSSSPITEALADINEEHKMPMVAADAATTSIFKKGRTFAFMIHSPGWTPTRSPGRSRWTRMVFRWRTRW